MFILTEPIAGAPSYRQAATALLGRFSATDQSVKDPARLFFGMKPGNGEAVFLSNFLPLAEVEWLVAEFDQRRRELERQASARALPPVDPAKLIGHTPDERYARRAIAEELAFLGSRPAGRGEHYPNVIPTALRLESLRLSEWLAPEAPALLDVAAIVLAGCAQNGSLAVYGEAHLGRPLTGASPMPAPALSQRAGKAPDAGSGGRPGVSGQRRQTVMEHEIRVARPRRPRRGDHTLIVTVSEAGGPVVFHDQANT